MGETINQVVDLLKDIQQEEGIPKKVKEKLDELIASLNDNQDIQMKVNKCLSELDQLSEDVNLPAFVRTQIWNASSLLEKIEN